jgi:hypothetical protein
MTRTVRAIVMAAALAATVGAADSPRAAFGVGVLRRDGVIIPFAAFNGKRWSTPWPPPQGDLTVPVTLGAVPSRWWGPTRPLDEWQATTAAGARAVRVVQPDWVDILCVRQIGLRTDYRSDQLIPPRTAQPYPKDGLAVSPPQAIDRIQIVPAAALELRPLLPVLLTSFNDAERRVEGRAGHPVERRAREGVAPTIEAVYAAGDNPRVYYVEATRSYRQLGQPAGECAAIGFGTGWFVRDSAGVRMLTMATDLLNCNRQGASYMLPLGALTVVDRLFWLAQFSGWDHERYVVLDIKKKSVDVIVNTWGGAC